jgi:hypothetical protein
LTTGSGATDLATLLTLAAGLPLLLDLAEPRAGAQAESTAIRQAAAPWADRVGTVRAACPAHPDLIAVLVRPDGHTAWLNTADAGLPADGLRQALTRWHGPASGEASEQVA